MAAPELGTRLSKEGQTGSRQKQSMSKYLPQIRNLVSDLTTHGEAGAHRVSSHTLRLTRVCEEGLRRAQQQRLEAAPESLSLDLGPTR